MRMIRMDYVFFLPSRVLATNLTYLVHINRAIYVDTRGDQARQFPSAMWRSLPAPAEVRFLHRSRSNMS
jgi:hypothetical protein